MLKRSGSLLLLALYIVTGVGFAINLHYCGRLVTSVNIDSSFKSCKEPGMMPGMKCCKNKRIEVKLKDAHEGQAPTLLGKLFSFQLAAVNYYIPAVLRPQSIWVERPSYRGPPDRLLSSTPVFLKNCNFRI